MKKLTAKQKIFIAEYLKDQNATRAAKEAGYSEKTARSQGQRLLTNVDIRGEIEKRLNKAMEKAEFSLNVANRRYEEIFQKAIEMKNLNAAVAAVNGQCKANGVGNENLNVNGGLTVEIVKFSDDGGQD